MSCKNAKKNSTLMEKKKSKSIHELGLLQRDYSVPLKYTLKPQSIVIIISYLVSHPRT